MLIQLERWGFRLVENNQLFAQEFNLAGLHIGVSGSIRTRTDPTGNLKHILITNAVSQGKMFLSVWIKDHLNDTLAVT